MSTERLCKNHLDESTLKQIRVGEEYDVVIQETSRRGDGVTHVKGFVIFVSETTPGQRVRVRIMQVGPRFATAEVLKDSTASVSQFDAELIKIARKYAGVVTANTVVFELKISLETAVSLLERFCDHGASRKIDLGLFTIYDFPDVRAQLGRLPNELIGLFLKQGTVTRASLVRATGVSIEALNQGLAELERNGIILRNSRDDTYQLRVTK
jgi:predicted RNA-binding protein with TRAM domain